MKLVEIFNTQISQTTHPGNELRNRQWYNDRSKVDYDNGTIGHGMSYLVKNDQDPHIVKKDSRNVRTSYDNRDGQHTYAETIISNKLAQDNPFLPRFYDYHTDKDEGGNKYYSFKSEKLFSASDDKIKKIPFETFASSILKDIFDNDKEKNKFMRNFSVEMEDYDEEYSPEPDYHELFVDEIGWYLGKMISTQNFSASSEKLNEALRLIGKLMKDHKLADDMHGANIMFRLGPHGVQLVLNDPLA